MIKLRKPARTGSRIVTVPPRSYTRAAPALFGRSGAETLRRRRRRVVRAAHLDDLGAEGLEHLLDDGVAFGARAELLLLAAGLVVGRQLLFVVGLARGPQLNLDADGAAEDFAADLAQELLVLGPRQRLAQVLALGRELDPHLFAIYPHAARAVERHGEQRLAAPFEPALEARRVVARAEAQLRLVRAARARVTRGSLRGDERDGSADHVLA